MVVFPHSVSASAARRGGVQVEIIAGMSSVPLTAPIRAWLESEARRMVAELLAEQTTGQQLGSLTPQDGLEFEERPIDRELAMMADGVTPARSYFRLAVIRAARDCLLLEAEIRRLPTTAA